MTKNKQDEGQTRDGKAANRRDGRARRKNTLESDLRPSIMQRLLPTSSRWRAQMLIRLVRSACRGMFCVLSLHNHNYTFLAIFVIPTIAENSLLAPNGSAACKRAYQIFSAFYFILFSSIIFFCLFPGVVLGIVLPVFCLEHI